MKIERTGTKERRCLFCGLFASSIRKERAAKPRRSEKELPHSMSSLLSGWVLRGNGNAFTYNNVPPNACLKAAKILSLQKEQFVEKRLPFNLMGESISRTKLEHG